MNKFWIIALTGLLIGQSAFAQEDARPSITERFQTLFENTGDLAVAYHLARILSLSNDEEASKWLSLLVQEDWQMGVDEMDLVVPGISPERQDLISQLQSRVIPQPYMGSIVSEFHDPLLLPESIAYDKSTGDLFAGSLLKPSIIARRENTGSATKVEREFLASDSGVTGIIYGIKYDVVSGWLWVVQNSFETDEVGSRLTVLDRQGQLVKHYQFSESGAGELNDLCLSRDAVYVTDTRTHRVFRGSRDGTVLRLFYENADLQYPNGIACNDQQDFVYVADYRGISLLSPTATGAHQRLATPDGFSLGGIDGLYLWQGNLIGIQNALGTPKVVKVNLKDRSTAADIQILEAFRPDYRIPTTGFIDGDCFYYIANSSLDALGADGGISDQTPPPDRAKIIALNLSKPDALCELV